MTGRTDGPDPRPGPEQPLGDDALTARLRAADPAATLPPADAESVTRLLAGTTRQTPDASAEAHHTGDRATGTRDRTRLTWLVAAAAAVLIAAGTLTALLTGGEDPAGLAGDRTGQTPSGDAGPATVTELTAAAPAQGRCMVPNAEVLAAQDIAFVGTVESIDDTTVTLSASRFYRGQPTDRVEVTASAPLLSALVGAVEFVEGGTYLVAATDGRVTVCGFSGPLTPEREQLYDAAFG